jgi:IS605 OrfB family transposase
MLETYQFCDPLINERNNEIWISLTFDVPELPVKQDSACGVDLGIRIAAATSEGKFYRDKKFNHEKRKLRFQKRKLRSAADRGSKTARRQLRKLGRKERNKNLNQTHHLTNKILSDSSASVIVLEDLTKLKRNLKKGNPYKNQNSISQVPFYQIRQVLTYKAPLYGKTVICVDPKYTSQIDHRTGKKDGARKGRRFYCKDGIVLDSDNNAAINIAKRSKLPVSYLTILDGQVIADRPYASYGVGK